VAQSSSVGSSPAFCGRGASMQMPPSLQSGPDLRSAMRSIRSVAAPPSPARRAVLHSTYIRCNSCGCRSASTDPGDRGDACTACDRRVREERGRKQSRYVSTVQDTLYDVLAFCQRPPHTATPSRSVQHTYVLRQYIPTVARQRAAG
jgi:hypothetical protein